MSILGTRVTRREDPPLLTGRGRFVADLDDPRLAGCHQVGFVRSPMAHARILEVDLSEVSAAPGVVGVFTAEDLDLVPATPRLPWVPASMARSWLAEGVVRFVGEPVAVVVVERWASVEDAVEAVIVDYEPLEVVVDPEAALGPASAVLFPDHGDNLACSFLTEAPDPDLFAGCDVVVSGRLVNQRLAACPLEGRASASVWEGDHLTHWMSTQNVHGAQRVLAGALGVERGDVRVVAGDVGGGFGAKIAPYPEDVLVAWASRRVGHPARWVETRTENLTAMGHGRDQVHTFTIGGTAEGRVLAYRLDVVANAGAYPTMAAFLPTFTRMMAPGTYDIARVETGARVVVTNTMSIEAYRGAGRPEATAAIERAMDRFALAVGRDPLEVRRMNLIPPDVFPFTTPTGATYDVGDYGEALDRVVAAAGYDELRAEQRRRREGGGGPLLGIGVSTYVEVTAGGGAPREYGAVSVEGDGAVVVRTGSSPHGQGLHTAIASLVADGMGVDPSVVSVVHGDTALVPRGEGTMGSRSMQLGGAAAVTATVELVGRAKALAAESFEADPADVVLEAGRFHVAGTPSLSLTWADLATAHPGELSVESDFRADGPTYPFGAHVAVVEIDPATGKVDLVRLVSCDDAGTVVNPLLVEGQRHGGMAQGVAQALYEEFRYDGDGNPSTSTFADYAIVAATELPRFELVTLETPTPFNPIGAKGIGESGTIGATPAVQSAVVDALSHLGVTHVEMPCTPEKVWQAIRAAAQSRGGGAQAR